MKRFKRRLKRRKSSAASSGGVSRLQSSQTRPPGMSSVDSAHPASHLSTRSQARATRWVNRNRNSLLNGLRISRQNNAPSHEDLITQVSSDHRAESSSPTMPSTNLHTAASAIRTSMSAERAIINDLMKSWDKDVHGYLSADKSSGRIRIMFENWNSLKLFQNGRPHVGRVNSLINKLQIDCVAGCEVGVNWSKVKENSSFHQIIGFGKERRSIVGYNKEEKHLHSPSQHGGTAMMTFNLLSNFVKEKGADKLGRWSWICVGSGAVATRLVVAYSPIKPGLAARKKANGMGSRVWMQQERYFRSRGIDTDPCTLFWDDLFRLLFKWRRAGEKVILMLDANECIYTGSLQQRLRDPELMMVEQFFSTTGGRAPASHIRGSQPICGIFASPGVTCVDAKIFQHYYGIGDHRVHVFEFDAESLLGESYPSLVQSSGRQLVCSIERVRRNYEKVLLQLVDRHRMLARLAALDEIEPHVSTDFLYHQFHLWDDELRDYMLSAERKCRKFVVNHVPWSPVIGMWSRRLKLYRWLEQYCAGKIPDWRNLKRSCRRHGLRCPSTYTLDEVRVLIHTCLKSIHDLKASAPRMRKEHLQQRLDAAKSRNDVPSQNEIVRILKREQDQKKYKRLRIFAGKPRSSPPVSVTVTNADGVSSTLKTQEGFNSAVGDALSNRFTLAHRAPIMTSSLVDEIGLVGDGPAVQHILDGSYCYPADTDEYTMRLLSEAPHLYGQLARQMLPEQITVEDYRYWLTAREKTQSSRSLLHFGHMKAAAFSETLSLLQVTKINICLRRGIPLERWLGCMTLLLEKVFGADRIEKLRAIGLWEADANFTFKVLFAHRMMCRADANGLLPHEQFARKNCTPNDGTLCKVWHWEYHHTLHLDHAVVEADLGDCYDAVNHPVLAIALRSMGVHPNSVKLLLSCLQSMSFYLRSGFGLSNDAISAEDDRPFMGVGQGCTAAPPAFNALSTLMINAYKRLGNDMVFQSSWSDTIATLAAILYVDDTDLLYRCPSVDMSLEDFVGDIQRRVNHWGHIVNASGGHIKHAKSSWFLTVFDFTNGVATPLRHSSSSPPTLTIPQPDGADVSIPLHSEEHSSKALGVFSGPSNSGQGHIDAMKEKGLGWSCKAMSSPLHNNEVWHSLECQAYPSIFYGVSCVSADPKYVDDAYQSVYFNVLPALGVNRHITRGFRTLPTRYQGLGLREPNLVILCEKLRILHRHFGQRTNVGRLSQVMFETFQLDCGLSGNVFALDFDRYGFLAAHGWWSNLWCLLSKYGVILSLRSDCYHPLPRKHDVGLMNKLVDSKLFDKSELRRINRVRHYKGVFVLSDLTHCDGVTLKENMLTTDRLNYCEGVHRYPIEYPTKSDFTLWENALSTIFSHTNTLFRPLGKYLRPPALRYEWLFSESDDLLFRCTADSTSRVDVYVPDGSISRRHARQFRFSCSLQHQPSTGTHYASLSHASTTTAVVHSITPIPSAPRCRSLQDIINDFDDNIMWEKFYFDDDGSWILHALLNGTLKIVHDGSYMPFVTTKACSCGFVLYCSDTDKRAQGSFAEASKYSSNYRGEWLGSLAALQVLLAILDTTLLSLDNIPPVQAHCDNMGVVNHNCDLISTLPEKQRQADMIRLCREYRGRLPFHVQYNHVDAHLDKLLRWDQLTREQQENCLMDSVAKTALLDAVIDDNFISGYFPHENVVVTVDGAKVSGSNMTAIGNAWGYKVARELFHSKKIVDKKYFGTIYWDGVEKSMDSFPRMFRVWVTKHVSHFCGTNRQLSRFDASVVNACPSCGCVDESTAHIVRCPSPGRTALYEDSVFEVVGWLNSVDTDSTLLSLIKGYLLGRGKIKAASLVTARSSYSVVARQLDLLGFDNFVEGRIPTVLVEFQHSYYATITTRWTAERWAKMLINRLLGLTHRQWLYRNAEVHHRGADGYTTAEHEAIVTKLSDFLWVDPLDLLSRDRGLLDEDFELLGSSPAAGAMWIEAMETALSAAEHSRRKSNRDRPLRRSTSACPSFSYAPKPITLVPVKDSEGSIRYKRRRRRS